jgi:hypothetical protein
VKSTKLAHFSFPAVTLVAIGLITGMIALPLNCHASSILLASIHDTESGGGSGSNGPGPNPQQTLTLSYSPTPAGLPPLPPCIGCEPIDAGFTGTTDYTAANTADFSDFASHLTNGIDEMIFVGNQYYNTPGIGTGGGTEGNFESGWFFLTTDLEGDTIDLIQRVISTNTYLFIPEGHMNSWSLDVTWEIFGTGPVVSPGPPPVPEPSSLLLLVSALAGGIFFYGTGDSEQRDLLV